MPSYVVYPQRTPNFIFGYEDSLGDVGKDLASKVVTTCETDYQAVLRFFPGVDQSQLDRPFLVLLIAQTTTNWCNPSMPWEEPNRGAYHCYCKDTHIYVSVNSSTAVDLVRALIVAEIVEVLPTAMRRGAGWDCTVSSGEGLSRVLAAELFPQSHTRTTGFATAWTWLDSDRPDWVSQIPPEKPSDADFVAVGCATLFLNYMRYQLGLPWDSIVLAAPFATLELASCYQQLRQSHPNLPQEAFKPFAALLLRHFPRGKRSNLQNDNPFPLADFGGRATGSGTIIQSDFINPVPGREHGNFDVLAIEDNNLVPYVRDNSNVANTWQRGSVISPYAIGPACFIQSDFKNPTSGREHGNFEALVFEQQPGKQKQLVHYTKDNSDVHNAWKPGKVLPVNLAGPACLIQSDFINPAPGREHGNFEAVVLEQTDEGTQLVHFFKDNSDVNKEWQRSSVISPYAIGPACFIQSDFKNPTPGRERGNFEALVFEQQPGKPIQLVHYTKDNSDVHNAWKPDKVLPVNPAGPACLIQSDFINPAPGREHGNFEAVVLEQTDKGTQLVHFFKDNSDVNNKWQRAKVISQDATGPGWIIQSDFTNPAPGREHGNFEVVVLEYNDLVHYYKDNSNMASSWTKGGVIN